MLKKALKPLVMLKNGLLNTLDPPVVILIYHRVATLATDPQLLAVAPERFRAHMQFLKDRFPVLRLEDDWSRVKEPSVVITFDDGYADNFLEALPILEEVGVPATFFVSSGAVGSSREFWWDELERVILGDWAFPASFRFHDGIAQREWPTVTRAERITLYREMHPLLKRADVGRREGWLGNLREWAGVDKGCRKNHRPLSVEELRRLAASDWVTIGAHTVNHPCLSALVSEAQQFEIEDSKRHLESWLGREITVFSYPFGSRKDYTRETVRFCRDAGFAKVAANFPGQAHRWTNAFQLPRQLVRDWPVEVFVRNLEQFWVA